MSCTEARIPLHSFASAMRERDAPFARRVAAFEWRFGDADADGLALLAQAYYLCWFHCAYQRDLPATCRAIGAGQPTGLSLCFQVTPERRAEMHAMHAGIRRWLRESDALPPGVSPETAEEVERLLGERNPARDALARLVLREMRAGLESSRVGLLVTGEAPTVPSTGRGDEWCPLPPQPPVDALVEEARRALAASPADAEELIRGILMEGQPACMLRVPRHLQVKLASIGALKWRGALPPDDGSKEEWKESAARCAAGLDSWLSGCPPEGEGAAEVHRALGEPTARKQAIVREFLLQPPEGTLFFDWLREQVAGSEGARDA